MPDIVNQKTASEKGKTDKLTDNESTAGKREEVGFDLNVIQFNSRILKTKKPHVVYFKYDTDNQVFRIDWDKFDIHAFGESKEEAIAYFLEELLMLWDEYAKESDENLSSAAKRLKRNLLDTFHE